MQMTARLRRKVLGDFGIQPRDTGQAFDQQLSNADFLQRSENNILQWIQYLPEDCVNRMIEMGWDTST